MLPANAPMVDEDAMLDDIFAQVQASGADVIDMRDDYRANKDQYLYFKTDHHWTPDGAYRAYQQFCTLKNLTPFDCNVYTKITVPDFTARIILLRGAGMHRRTVSAIMICPTR